MPIDTSEFIHPRHLAIFARAAAELDCHILVRKTGSASMRWIGMAGYTGKRVDLKANTAAVDVGRWRTAGLVCSPLIHPTAFGGKMDKARKHWAESSRFISAPENGFDDGIHHSDCRTPYLLQTDPEHPHYGCVALVDMGLIKPHYVHGDYDLYAIIPAGSPFSVDNLKTKTQWTGSTMSPSSLTQSEIASFQVKNEVGPLAFRLSTLINVRIAALSPDLLGALMVNHGSQINIPSMRNFEEVLAVMPKARNGSLYKILANEQQHEAFYQEA